MCHREDCRAVCELYRTIKLQDRALARTIDCLKKERTSSGKTQYTAEIQSREQLLNDIEACMSRIGVKIHAAILSLPDLDEQVVSELYFLCLLDLEQVARETRYPVEQVERMLESAVNHFPEMRVSEDQSA